MLKVVLKSSLFSFLFKTAAPTIKERMISSFSKVYYSFLSKKGNCFVKKKVLKTFGSWNLRTNIRAYKGILETFELVFSIRKPSVELKRKGVLKLFSR